MAPEDEPVTTLRQDVRVADDGTVTVAVGKGDAGRLVRVTVEPSPRPSETSREEWLEVLDQTAGQWVGDFPAMDDPPPAERDPL